MMIKNIKSVGVLVAICSVIALLLALTNQITAPKIKENEQIKAAAALREVMPLGKTFTLMDVSSYTLPDTVTEVQKEDNGKGYVIKLTTKGFGTDMIIMCGVDTNGVVTGAKCLSSNETLGYEKTYGANFTDKNAAGVDAVDTVGGATMTTSAYKAAIKDALNTVSILKGEVVDLRSEEEKAVDKMKEDLGATKEADLKQYTLPQSVTKAFVGDKGYVIYLTVKGWAEGMEIVCGVGTDNKIVNAICLSSNETIGVEKTYGQQFVGKDSAGVEAVDTVTKPTAPLTATGYKQAVKDALNAALVLSGEDVDIRTPEQILQDNLAVALPAGEGKFTKLFITEVVAGVDAIYAADNGKGHVCVMGEQFVSVDDQGNSDNAVAAAAVEAIKASTSEDITASFQSTISTLIENADRSQKAVYRNLQKFITSVKKTATGNYVLEVKGEGYGIKSEYHASGEHILICVAISADGKILDCFTISQSESENVGDVCAKEEFTTRFDGKTEADLDGVDGVAGATMTFTGYKEALRRCLTAVTILEGGAA